MLNGGRIHTASWMPGSHWEGKSFDPIYWVATAESKVQAAQCSGLFVWKCVLDRPESWGSSGGFAGAYCRGGTPGLGLGLGIGLEKGTQG
jgi:hypothetical protein